MGIVNFAIKSQSRICSAKGPQTYTAPKTAPPPEFLLRQGAPFCFRFSAPEIRSGDPAAVPGAALSPPPPQAHWNLLMIGRAFSVRSCRFMSNFIFYQL